jgi:hypothetical protein
MLGGASRDPADLERFLSGSGVPPELSAVESILSLAAGNTIPAAQGFLLDPIAKACIEAHAMELAKKHYSAEWDVADHHSKHPYDLLCTRGTDALYVEVKGTTSTGAAVIVTSNEVTHARTHGPATELFVVTKIRLDRSEDGRLTASEGQPRILVDWAGAEAVIVPLAFKVVLG